MPLTPHGLILEQIGHLRSLAAGLAARALGGDPQVLETLLRVQNQLLELTHYITPEPAFPLAPPSEAPAPMDLTPFRVPAPPLYTQMDERSLDGTDQPSVTMPPAPWDLDPPLAEREPEQGGF